MTVPIVEDFAAIAACLRRIENERRFPQPDRHNSVDTVTLNIGGLILTVPAGLSMSGSTVTVGAGGGGTSASYGDFVD